MQHLTARATSGHQGCVATYHIAQQASSLTSTTLLQPTGRYSMQERNAKTKCGQNTLNQLQGHLEDIQRPRRLCLSPCPGNKTKRHTTLEARQHSKSNKCCGVIVERAMGGAGCTMRAQVAQQSQSKLHPLGAGGHRRLTPAARSASKRCAAACPSIRTGHPQRGCQGCNCGPMADRTTTLADRLHSSSQHARSPRRKPIAANLVLFLNIDAFTPPSCSPGCLAG